jgi:hypothetical protein
VHAFEEEEQRGEQRGEVEKRHDLHQVVVQELCREGARAVQPNERGASDSEGGDAVAPELKMCELTQRGMDEACWMAGNACGTNPLGARAPGKILPGTSTNNAS